MGNHHSSNDGEESSSHPHFPSTAYLLKSPPARSGTSNCFGRDNGSSEENCTSKGKVGGKFSKPVRSQSFIMDTTASKFAVFSSHKGRRKSYDVFPNLKGMDGSKLLQVPRFRSKDLSPSAKSATSPLPPVTENVVANKEGATVALDIPESLVTPGSTGKNLKSYWNANLEKFAKHLAQASRGLDKSVGHDRISRAAFQKFVVSHSPVGERYLWEHLIGSETKGNAIKTSTFIDGAEKLCAIITDKDQISFYVKLFSKGKDMLHRQSFVDILIASYQLSSDGPSKFARDLRKIDDFAGNQWIEAVTKSCFHIKEEMSVFFVCNWISTNLPRLFIPSHKYYTTQLISGHSRMAQLSDSPAGSSLNSEDGGESSPEGNNISNNETVSKELHNHVIEGMDPLLMWFLLASLPQAYLSSFGIGPQNAQKPLSRMNSRDLLLKLLNCDKPERWSILYTSADQGLSINRFQHHVFNYRGPTVMIITCEDDYAFLLGVDTEWKESCHFWGGESCTIIQLKPEFHVIEKGEKSMYANFSIRGYPFGLQAGRDPRNVSLEIKPDFEYIYFKKIPCKILSLVVYGCGTSQVQQAQTEHKKWEAKESEKQKKINLHAGEWSENPDKYLLELAGSYKSYGN